jgi:hypothetical protein
MRFRLFKRRREVDTVPPSYDPTPQTKLDIPDYSTTLPEPGLPNPPHLEQFDGPMPQKLRLYRGNNNPNKNYHKKSLQDEL